MSLDFLDPNKKPDLVYTEAPHMDSLVFAPLDVALRVDQLHEALAAKRWCEFEYLMPTQELDRLIMERNSPEEEWLKDDKFEIPAAFGEVDLEQLCPEHYSGDYVEWLQQKQTDWVPKDILARWGRKEHSLGQGSFWIMQSIWEKPIIKALRGKNLRVEKRSDLNFW